MGLLALLAGISYEDFVLGIWVFYIILPLGAPLLAALASAMMFGNWPKCIVVGAAAAIGTLILNALVGVGVSDALFDSTGLRALIISPVVVAFASATGTWWVCKQGSEG